MDIYEKIILAVVDGDCASVEENIRQAVLEGYDLKGVLDNGLIGGMSITGAKFKAGEIYVPEVLIAARAMQVGMKIIKPLLTEAETENKGTILIGTVEGDLHNIGKDLVIMMLEGAGYKVIDMGVDVSTEKFIEAIIDNKPQVLGLSALLTTTMPQMEITTTKVKAVYNNQVKVIVGGAPITQEFAGQIGADGYSPDASTAVDVVTNLLN